MPAHKRSWSDSEDPKDQLHHPLTKQSRPEREQISEDEENHQEQGGRDETEEVDEDELQEKKEEEEEDTEGSKSSSCEDKPEFVFVELPDIRKDVQCPICLGIIKKTRTVMECLHRFCRECIDKSMRLGNNECPACRTHCASRRSLRDDPNYDALIAALYPDIDKYEEEELAFHEEEMTRNKQIQESIAQIFLRQSEALTKKRTSVKDTTGVIITRSQRNHRNANLRRRNGRGVELQVSEDNEDENDNNGGKDSSSADERFTEVRSRRRKRRPGIRSSQPSSSVGNSDGGCNENDFDASRGNRGISPGLVWNSEILAWGRGGARSHTRHGIGGGSSSKSSRSNRLTKLVDYLQGLEESNDQLDVHFMLVSLEKESMTSLQRQHLCCRPSLTVKHLREYVDHNTPLQADEVEIFVVKKRCPRDDQPVTDQSSITKDGPDPMDMEIDPKDELQILEEKETLAGLKGSYTSITSEPLILGYRRKQSS